MHQPRHSSSSGKPIGAGAIVHLTGASVQLVCAETRGRLAIIEQLLHAGDVGAARFELHQLHAQLGQVATPTTPSPTPNRDTTFPLRHAGQSRRLTRQEFRRYLAGLAGRRSR